METKRRRVGGREGESKRLRVKETKSGGDKGTKRGRVGREEGKEKLWEG